MVQQGFTSRRDQLPGQDSNLDKENQNLLGARSNILLATTCDASPARPDRALTKSIAGSPENYPDLARVLTPWAELPEPLRDALARWPQIPEAIRRAILALVETVPNSA